MSETKRNERKDWGRLVLKNPVFEDTVSSDQTSLKGLLVSEGSPQGQVMTPASTTPELIEAIDSLPAGEKMNQADLETVKAIRDTCMQSYPNTPNRIRAEALTALLDEHESLVTEITSLRNQLSVAKVALERIEKGEDYHGSSLGARSIAREALSAMKSEEEKQDAL